MFRRPQCPIRLTEHFDADSHRVLVGQTTAPSLSSVPIAPKVAAAYLDRLLDLDSLGKAAIEVPLLPWAWHWVDNNYGLVLPLVGWPLLLSGRMSTMGSLAERQLVSGDSPKGDSRQPAQFRSPGSTVKRLPPTWVDHVVYVKVRNGAVFCLSGFGRRSWKS